MNRFLGYFNLFGVFALTLLSAAQWRTNSRLNLEEIELEKTRLEQVAKIAEQDKAIKGCAADLEEFRGRLTKADASLHDTESRLAATAAERDQLSEDRTRLAEERGRLRANLDHWIAAVTERDKALKQAGEDIQKLCADRNEAVTRFNELVGKYNAMVKAANVKDK